MKLDRGTGRLLEKVVETCREGGYKIIDEAELAAAADTDGEGIRAMLGLLQDERLIDLRYAEEGVYCVRPLPEGRRYFERLEEERRDTLRRRRDAVLFSALGSFVGALLACLLALFVVP